MTVGIYEIVCTANGKKYIGQSNNIEKRWRQHRSTLNRNIRHNKYFQNAWNKYGESAFKFIIIEECDTECLTEKEQENIDKYSSDELFNWGKCADNALRGTSRPLDVIEKIRAAKMGDKNPMYGRIFTKEHRERMTRHGEKNHFYGKTHTEETREKISKALTGKKRGKATMEHVENNRKSQIRVKRLKSTLSEEDVITIRLRRQSGESYVDISEDYSLRPAHVGKICRHEIWKCSA